VKARLCGIRGALGTPVCSLRFGKKFNQHRLFLRAQ